MTLKELIDILEEFRKKYGDDIEVCKLKKYDYLAHMFKDQIQYNEKQNKIEI